MVKYAQAYKNSCEQRYYIGHCDNGDSETENYTSDVDNFSRIATNETEILLEFSINYVSADLILTCTTFFKSHHRF